MHCREDVDSTIANNVAYGITDKHENIKLQDNKCYKSVPPAELNLTTSYYEHVYNVIESA